jgi:orotidine-5'-phosphate decarboxylase
MTPDKPTFVGSLAAAARRNRTLLCVGLDPDLDLIPPGLGTTANETILRFNRAIVDATRDLVCCYKPQAAFYSAVGAEPALEATIAYIREVAPGIPVILDSKRGDIASTATAYAKEAFVRYGADAATVNPYMGFDSVKPFTVYADRGVVVLCKTSNPSSVDVQDLPVDGRPLYERVALLATGPWNANKNVLLVVGATHPAELGRLRELVGQGTWFLVPGIGSQGGSAAESVRHGANTEGLGVIASASRSVLYASRSASDFQERARASALLVTEEIRGASRAFAAF